ELFDKPMIEDALFIHFLRQGADLLLGELADVVAKKNLVFVKLGERGRSRLQKGIVHWGNSTTRGNSSTPAELRLRMQEVPKIRKAAGPRILTAFPFRVRLVFVML